MCAGEAPDEKLEINELGPYNVGDTGGKNGAEGVFDVIFSVILHC